MSMRLATPAENAVSNAYVVAAPRPVDALSGTLRRAFVTTDPDIDQFADLMRKLDAIDIKPR